MGVAPRTGARIETAACVPAVLAARVAPRTGARIETTGIGIATQQHGATSPPARGRGSKRRPLKGDAIVKVSPPARGRGSKPVDWSTTSNSTLVAPRTGARIETACRTAIAWWSPRRPPHGGADRNVVKVAGLAPEPGRPRTGARIETRGGHGHRPRRPRSPPARGRGSKLERRRNSGRATRRPPHGGADRNYPISAITTRSLVAPRTGARIETNRPAVCRRCRWSPPARGRGSKHQIAARKRRTE